MKNVFLIALILVTSFSAFADDCRKASEEQRKSLAKSMCGLYKKVYYTDVRFNLKTCKTDATVRTCDKENYAIVSFKRTNNQEIDCNGYLSPNKLEIAGGIDCGDE